MAYASLPKCSILVVEGDSHVVFEVVTALNRAGAISTATTSVRHALTLIEHDDELSAVVLLGNGDRTELHARLSARDIPYVSYRCSSAEGDISVRRSNPTSTDALLKTLENLLVDRPSRKLAAE
jgi:hypothetical protein